MPLRASQTAVYPRSPEARAPIIKSPAAHRQRRRLGACCGRATNRNSGPAGKLRGSALHRPPYWEQDRMDLGAGTEDVPALVIGSGITVLGAVRALGRAGNRVHAA